MFKQSTLLILLGLASLLAWRLARERPNTFSLSVNDYGLELMTVADTPWTTAFRPDRGLLAEEGLLRATLVAV